MMKSGIPITEVLETLSLQTKSGTFGKILRHILRDIENGQTLAASLRKHPHAFDEFYVSMIEIGENAGTLEENLIFLSDQLTKSYALRKKIQGALLYPALVLVAMSIMGGIISFWLLPQLVDFFRAFKVELPLSSRILLAFANLMKYHAFSLLGGLFLFVSTVYLVTRLPFVKTKWHILILKLPLLGNLVSYHQLARFSRNLGTLLKSGVPVVQSLEITANTLSNLKFKSDMSEVSHELIKGQDIASVLGKKSFNEFPPLTVRMIGAGEKTGHLDEMLLYLADFYDEEIDQISKNLSNILEPVLLIIIGVGVGFVALAIISPIYGLIGSIRG